MLKRGKRTNASKGKKSNSKKPFSFLLPTYFSFARVKGVRKKSGLLLLFQIFFFFGRTNRKMEEESDWAILPDSGLQAEEERGRKAQKANAGEGEEAPLVILPWKRGGGNNHNKQEMWRGAKIISPSPLPPYPTFPILCIRCNAHPQEDVYTVG